MKPVDLAYWTIGKGLLSSITRALVPLKAYGTERVPREGGCVLAMNHFSYVDPPAFGTVCPRRIVFVAKTELFDVPGLAQIIGLHGTVAIRRGESDRDAFRRMREALRENELLGLFVEGTRQTSGVPGKAMPGAAMLAIQEGVPVLPAAIHGSQFWTKGNRHPVSIAFGEPMRFAEHPRNSKGYAAASAEIDVEIRRLWEWLVRMHELGRPPGTPPRRAEAPIKVS
ncbi:MAG: lysophospholipid acyltransferase family protein [Gaiellaceae bacterium]